VRVIAMVSISGLVANMVFPFALEPWSHVE
jgi:hypothetical protein